MLEGPRAPASFQMGMAYSAGPGGRALRHQPEGMSVAHTLTEHEAKAAESRWRSLAPHHRTPSNQGPAAGSVDLLETIESDMARPLLHLLPEETSAAEYDRMRGPRQENAEGAECEI